MDKLFLDLIKQTHTEVNEIRAAKGLAPYPFDKRRVSKKQVSKRVNNIIANEVRAMRKGKLDGLFD